MGAKELECDPHKAVQVCNLLGRVLVLQGYMAHSMGTLEELLSYWGAGCFPCSLESHRLGCYVQVTGINTSNHSHGNRLTFESLYLQF